MLVHIEREIAEGVPAGKDVLVEENSGAEEARPLAGCGNRVIARLNSAW